MDARPVLIPDHVPVVWPEQAATICVCVVPVPEVRAVHKGAARTHCARCGLPVRLDFAGR
jgi:hypothetical protein